MSYSDIESNEIDQELLQTIMFEMILKEKENNRREELTDIQMVGELLKILEKKV